MSKIKLQDLFLEEYKTTILIEKLETEIDAVHYIPTSDKEAMANEILSYVFELQEDEAGKIVNASPVYDKYLLEIIKTYIVVKNYLVGLEIPTDSNGDIDYIKTHDIIKAYGMMEDVYRQISDVELFMELLDNKMEQLIKLSDVNRQIGLVKSIDILAETMNTLVSDLTVQNKLNLDKLEKEIDSMPKNATEMKEIIDAVAKVATKDGVENTVLAVESIK